MLTINKGGITITMTMQEIAAALTLPQADQLRALVQGRELARRENLIQSAELQLQAAIAAHQAATAGTAEIDATISASDRAAADQAAVAQAGTATTFTSIIPPENPKTGRSFSLNSQAGQKWAQAVLGVISIGGNHGTTNTADAAQLDV